MCFSGLQTLPHFPCLNSVTLGSDLRIWVQSLEFRFHGGCRGFREITYFSASILYLLSECFLAVVASNLLSVTLWRPSLLQTAKVLYPGRIPESHLHRWIPKDRQRVAAENI